MRALVLACLTLAASGARGQDATAPGVAGAEAVVALYTEAATANDWETAVNHIAPADLARFQDFARLMVEAEPFTATMLGLGDEMESAELMAAFMGAAMQQNPVMGDMMASVQTEALGTIPEGDSLTHVVSRTRMDILGRSFTAVETTTARWDGARWYVGLDDELQAMIIGIEAALEAPEAFMGDEPQIIEGAPRDPKKE